MLSNIFNRARSFLSRTPSDQNLAATRESQSSAAQIPVYAMVSTSRNTPLNAETASASPKRRPKRSLDSSSTPIHHNKKLRRSVDRVDDVEDGGKNGSEAILDTIRVHVPGQDHAEGEDDGSGDQVLHDGHEEEDVEEETAAESLPLRSLRELSEESISEDEDMGEEIPESRQESEDQDIPPPEPVASARSSKKSREMVASPTKWVDKASPSSKMKTKAQNHIRFNSAEPDEPAPALPSELAPQMVSEHKDESSDDDEAPEAITQASAVRQTEKAKAEANKAIQEAEAASQRKQEERVARRAEEQKQKKRRQEKLERRAQQKAFKALKKVQLDDDVPDLLPESILAAAPEQRPATPPRGFIDTSIEDQEAAQRNRHIKFLGRGEKPVKDVKRGSLQMRVLEKPNVLLAPKGDLNSRNIKEHWMGRRAVEKKAGAKGQAKGKPQGRWQHNQKLERKKVGGSFLIDT